MFFLVIFFIHVATEKLNFITTRTYQIFHHRGGIEARIGNEKCDKLPGANVLRQYKLCYSNDEHITVRPRQGNSELTINNVPENTQLVASIQTYDVQYTCKQLLNVKDICRRSSTIIISSGNTRSFEMDECSPTYDKYCNFEHNIDQDLFLNTYHELFPYIFFSRYHSK